MLQSYHKAKLMVPDQVRAAVSEVLGRLGSRVREERWVEDTLRLRVTVRSHQLRCFYLSNPKWHFAGARAMCRGCAPRNWRWRRPR